MSQINRNILSIARCDVQYRSEQVAPLGLKSCHTSYLMEICRNPGISQDKLAQAIFINKSNIARQVAVLEEDGFIRRVPSQADRRVMELYPTEKALAVLPQIQNILLEWERYITEHLTEEELTLLTKVLSDMMDRAARWTEQL